MRSISDFSKRRPKAVVGSVERRFASSRENEDSLSFMRRADFARRKQSCRRFVTHSLQAPEDMQQNGRSCWIVPLISFELCGEDATDVFEQDESRLNSSNCSDDVGEDVSRVLVGKFLTGQRKGLTRKSATCDVHQSTKGLCIEGAQIREDRSRSHLTFFHLRDQIRDAESFDLHISHRAASWPNSLQCESESVVSSAKAEVSWAGTIHTSYPFQQSVNVAP